VFVNIQHEFITTQVLWTVFHNLVSSGDQIHVEHFWCFNEWNWLLL